jgi:LEA14-like dessication related protein
MKNIYIAAGVIAAAYFGYMLYQKKQSIDAVTFDIVDFDLQNLKLTVDFTNVGNSTINVTAVQNQIYVNDSLVGTANRLASFSINKSSNTKVKFDIKASAVGGITALLNLFKNHNEMPKIRIETTINANGMLFNKTTNI